MLIAILCGRLTKDVEIKTMKFGEKERAVGNFTLAVDDGYWDNKSKEMMNTDGYTKIIKAFGAQRILFGSDSPWTNQKKSREFIESIPLEADEIAMILGGNAGKILHSFK